MDSQSIPRCLAILENAPVMRKLLIERRLKSNGGAEGSRTPDLLIANETLYQLSYDPIHQRLATGNLAKTRRKLGGYYAAVPGSPQGDFGSTGIS